jgi:hypothetical protein
MRVTQPSWSVATDGWFVDDHPECITLRPPEDDAALQISARHKTDGRIEPAEVRAMADRTAQQDGVEVLPAVCGAFTGVTVTFSEGAYYWRRWWVANDTVLLFVTYNINSSGLDRHEAEVDAILRSLAREDAAVEQ